MKRYAWGKCILAVLLCAALSVCIWVATIWNNFTFHNALIADDYLVPVATLALLVVVLGINPLLRRFAPRLSFSRRGLAVICGVLMIVALPPSAGILRQLAFPLVDAVRRANTEQRMATAYKALDPPKALYPDSLEYEAKLPVAEPFLDELEPGKPVPWGRWVAPIASWSGFVVPWYVMMIALSVVMTRYWLQEERVPFPLLTIFRSLVDVPEGSSRKVPAIFTSRLFWVGCVVVFLLHSLAQGHRYAPASVPVIDIHWNLWPYFQEPPWRYLPGWIKGGRLFFTFLAVAYFLPNRTGFSIWSAQILTALYIMVGTAYFPPFNGGVVSDARAGVTVMFALCVAWLARKHLAHVARCMFSRPSAERDRAYRLAGWCMVGGCLGMFTWLMWVRVPPVFAVLFVVSAVMATLTLMRVVAETGLPLFFLTRYTFEIFLRMLPLALRTLPTMYFGGILSAWLGEGQRMCVGAVATQAMAIEPDDDTPRHLKLGGLFIFVAVVALVCGWLLILWMSYHHSDTPMETPIAGWGRQQFRVGENLMMDTLDGIRSTPISDHLPYILGGSVLVIALFELCKRYPAWPLHPIGLLGAGTWCVNQIWPSVFLGWLVRNILIQLGGTRAYNNAKPLFIGCLMGELFALLFWAGFAAYLAINSLEYQSVNILPY
ncbi:MAG: hypothetical protein GC164_07410 [Phycisphaera sp.]|nr:hypothetical protein [Phycisphaera sp.]